MGLSGVTRPCAFVFIREAERVLVARMTDPTDGSPFYRPLGGGIEFQERAADAARREIREELGVELGELRLLGVVENVFEYDGKRGHEICFVYDADPVGWSVDRFDGYAVPGAAAAGGDETACVVGADELRTLAPLYPDGVRDLLG
ncbi:MAG TPA: NUDIX domain-containing protein [Actinomycetota bacterium]|jgi:ADP-ribose pyrophosphatase YjhB (NUDIX family)